VSKLYAVWRAFLFDRAVNDTCSELGGPVAGRTGACFNASNKRRGPTRRNEETTEER
jgi:hypothetical protein